MLSIRISGHALALVEHLGVNSVWHMSLEVLMPGSLDVAIRIYPAIPPDNDARISNLDTPSL